MASKLAVVARKMKEVNFVGLKISRESGSKLWTCWSEEADIKSCAQTSTQLISVFFVNHALD